MALWGNNDNKLTATVGLVTASGINGQVTGTGTTFTNFAVGDTLTLGVGATSGFGVIKNIDSDTSMQVICLLYTSPSPRDLVISRMPSSA